MKYFYTIIHRLKSFAGCEKGLAFIELALCLPMLLILFIGGIEVSRYIVAVEDMEKGVDSVALAIANVNPNIPPTLNPTTFSNFLNALMLTTPELFKMSLANAAGTGFDGGIIITYVVNTPTPTVAWQYCYNAGADFALNSKVTQASGTGNAATQGGAADLSGFTYNVTPNEEMVIGEIFYRYAPVIAGQAFVSTLTPLYRTALVVPPTPSGSTPRSLVPTSPPSSCP